eukprot:3545038-Rhodomonas_salina.2
MPGTDTAYGATRREDSPIANGLACLRARYVMSGTDSAYAATGDVVAGAVDGIAEQPERVVIAAYARAIRCPEGIRRMRINASGGGVESGGGEEEERGEEEEGGGEGVGLPWTSASNRYWILPCYETWRIDVAYDAT